ncbi:MAG: type II secretion system protein GspD [Planctomycetota bacterium]|jgi:type IV pilus assembly protein PilQ
MLKDVFEFISLEVGVSIEAEPAIEDLRVSIKVRDVKWKHVLDIICRKKKVAYTEIELGFYYVTQAPQVRMKFQDADLKVVLELLAQQAAVNIIIAPEVIGKVSCYLNNVPWDAALSTIVKTLGYIVVKEDNNIMRIVTRASLRDQLETRIYQLAYVRPPEDYRAIYDTRAASGGTTSGANFVERNQLNQVERFTLLNALKAVISKELGDLQYDLATNTIIVTDTKPKLDEMEIIIDKLDVAPIQVFLEVKFIRTTMNKLSERGIRFDMHDTPEEDGLFLKVDFPDPDILTGRGGGTYEFDVGRWESIREDFNSIGLIDFTQTEILLRLIKANEDTRIIQAPRVFTLNHQEATIFVGERVPYVKQESRVDQSGNVVITIEEDDNSPIAVGFTLFVTPHVVKDSDEIMLTVIPKTSTLTGTSSVNNPGFDRFSAILPGGAESYLDLPRTLDQIIVTKMLVRDGSTAVIGGLVSEDRREITSKIPFISSIPIIGNLFTWKRKVNRKENLIIFVTPTIIRDRESSVRLSKRMLEIEREFDHFWQTYQSSAIDFEVTNIDKVLKALAKQAEGITSPEEAEVEEGMGDAPEVGEGEAGTPEEGEYVEPDPEGAAEPDPLPDPETPSPPEDE